MYKKVAQMKLRFPFRGQCTMEDLFDLSLDDLNQVYQALARQQSQTTDSLLSETTAADEILALKIEVVKDVFATKQAELEARKNAATRIAQKRRIMEIIADKQDESLRGKSLDELQEMIDGL